MLFQWEKIIYYRIVLFHNISAGPINSKIGWGIEKTAVSVRFRVKDLSKIIDSDKLYI